VAKRATAHCDRREVLASVSDRRAKPRRAAEQTPCETHLVADGNSAQGDNRAADLLVGQQLVLVKHRMSAVRGAEEPCPHSTSEPGRRMKITRGIY
jgi:hypothetical protein